MDEATQSALTSWVPETGITKNAVPYLRAEMKLSASVPGGRTERIAPAAVEDKTVAKV
jgi:hypothetical protein